MLPTVLILTPYFLPGFKGGGPVKSIASIISSLSEHYQFKILCYNFDLGGAVYENIKENKWIEYSENVQVFYSSKQKYFRNINSILKTENYDICYLNSFFSYYFSIYPLFLLSSHKKIILAPRGEFSPGALSINSLKKKLYLNLLKFTPLYNKISRWHATSNLERDDILNIIEQYKFTSQRGISVVPNLSLNFSSSTTSLPDYFQQYIEDSSVKSDIKICFLSRLSPKKNLHFIASILKNCHSNIHFDFYGPIEDPEYYNFCLSKFAELGANITVNYRGEVSPIFVSQLISQYDLFLFPTLGENFGHVIAESFSAGTPVLISDQTPWRQLKGKGVGWDISLNCPDEFSKIIDEYGKKNIDERNQQRLRCLSFYEVNFNNALTLKNTINLFKF
ncbi:glycosyltransferase family 4 protein [Acinetobacter sp. YH12124]|uniref:glycosyltransferase family 4 protein n=1 Tax=Acinetobacter sp. YH12124 TaxID=2601109 RepID=UPI0015D2F98E|nr:glycosyltransferase family 4 protein [Acinetobacter sp. YH12124]